MSAGLSARLLKAADDLDPTIKWESEIAAVIREAAAALDGQGDAAVTLLREMLAEVGSHRHGFEDLTLAAQDAFIIRMRSVVSTARGGRSGDDDL